MVNQTIGELLCGNSLQEKKNYHRLLFIYVRMNNTQRFFTPLRMIH